jgi:spectinomycin phosphotransferase
MLEDPDLDTGALTDALRAAYGIEASALAFVPGYDARAASYKVTTDEARFFLKVRFGAVQEASLEVPAALLDAGVRNVLAPIRARSSALWTPMDDRCLVLYPFVSGRSAVIAGLSADQWRTFGATLRAVHESGLERRFRDRIPADSFSLPASIGVDRALALARDHTHESAAARRLAAILRDEAKRVAAMLERAEELGAILRGRSFDRVLCHADIHAANILITDDDGILLVDWDGPMIAPRERDLLFVIGSRIARRVEPHEEAWFFEGYGAVSVDRDAVIFYRYERILEDIGEFAASVLLDASLSEAARDEQTEIVAGFFSPGGIIETVETRG